MSDFTEKIFNIETNETTIRQLTEQEIAFIKTQRLETENALAIERDAILKATTDRTALLARLGITAEEAALLLGGTN